MAKADPKVFADAWLHYNPVEVFFGPGVSSKVSGSLQGRTLLVCGRSATRRMLLVHDLQKTLGEDLVIFDEVEPNPSAATMQRGVELCREAGCQTVVGLGGGSPLDAAKVIAAAAPDQDTDVLSLLRKEKELKSKGLRAIAVPTTAGTGSEVTPYSVITDLERQAKGAIASPHIYFDQAYVDPELTYSMPARLAAATGLDVLAHAFEAMWNKASHPLAFTYGIEAVRLVLSYLRPSVKDSDARARQEMARASLIAGLAISEAGTTVNHSLSYPLSVRYDVPHGFACAISLPSVLRLNAQAVGEKLSLVARICGYDGIDELITAVDELMDAVGAPRRLSEVGVREDELDELAREAYGPNVARNPVAISEGDMRRLVEELY